MDKNEFMEKIKETSEKRIHKLHHLSKKIWKYKNWKPIDIQNKCSDAWNEMKQDLGCNIIPLIPVSEERPTTDLIFGSGSFSTGEYQIKQYQRVKEYATNVPVILQGIVSNKSDKHNCNVEKISKKYKIPLMELDFIDWYNENIDKKEPNPIRASRYWYSKDDLNRPKVDVISRRFNIRQNQFHKALGEKIASINNNPTDIVSARGYNFQFCSNIFHRQNFKPHINDTHPADLTYVNPLTKECLYPGWQSDAVQLMMKDHHTHFRASLIEVEYMDNENQIDQLDAGKLLSMNEGVHVNASLGLNASEIQNALKVMDDYFYCTLAPTGLLLFWGITDKKFLVSYQDLKGNEINVNQQLVIVGNKIHSGINAWGINIDKDLQELEEFLFN